MPEEGLTPVNPEQGNLENPGTPAVETPVVETPVVEEPQIDWEAEGNPYKKRYGDSQSQVQPLVRQLQEFADFDHTTRTWKPRSATPAVQSEDFDKLLDGYDPEFKKAVGGYVSDLVQKAQAKKDEESAYVNDFNSTVVSSRSKAMEEFGTEFEFVKNGAMNSQSPLYKLADEIVINKYAIFNPDSTFNRYSTPEAEYLATVEAYAILAKRAKQGNPDKSKLNAIQGKGTKSAADKKKLSYEEYNKLSNEEKDAYDLEQTGG